MGFNHISLNPDYKLLKSLIEWGLNTWTPFYGWLTAVHTAVVNIALKFDKISFLWRGWRTRIWPI